MQLPSLEDLLDPGIKLISPELAGGFFTTESPEKSTLSLWVNSNMFANSSQIHASEDEMVGWHHQPNGYEFEPALGVGGQRSLASYSQWGCKESE